MSTDSEPVHESPGTFGSDRTLKFFVYPETGAATVFKFPYSRPGDPAIVKAGHHALAVAVEAGNLLAFPHRGGVYVPMSFWRLDMPPLIPHKTCEDKSVPLWVGTDWD